MEDKIITKIPMTISIGGYNKEKVDEPYLLRANKIEFINNHLMFYLGKELVFKVWLKEDKLEKYKNINEVLRDVEVIIRN